MVVEPQCQEPSGREARAGHNPCRKAKAKGTINREPPRPADPPVDYPDRFEALTGRSLRECPHCRTGVMVVIDSIARFTVCQPVPDTS